MIYLTVVFGVSSVGLPATFRVRTYRGDVLYVATVYSTANCISLCVPRGGVIVEVIPRSGEFSANKRYIRLTDERRACIGLYFGFTPEPVEVEVRMSLCDAVYSLPVGAAVLSFEGS